LTVQAFASRRKTRDVVALVTTRSPGCYSPLRHRTLARPLTGIAVSKYSRSTTSSKCRNCSTPRFSRTRSASQNNSMSLVTVTSPPVSASIPSTIDRWPLEVNATDSVYRTTIPTGRTIGYRTNRYTCGFSNAWVTVTWVADIRSSPDVLGKRSPSRKKGTCPLARSPHCALW